MQYADTIRGFIIENFLFGEERQINADTSFLANSIIDSTGMLELVGFLEETYGVAIGDDELIPENLDSLKNLEAFLVRKVGAAAGQSAG